MEINEAIRTRRSIRAYKPDPVPRQVLEEILETARWAGSFMNMQPWDFAVLGGEVMKEWKRRILERFESDAPPEEREVTPPQMPFPEPYSQRAEEFRATIDNHMFPPGTENLEEKQRTYTISGLIVRDAPNAIVVYMEKAFINSPLPLIGIGSVIQAVCLAALSYGLGTGVMGRPVESPQMLREMLGIPQTKSIPCVIAIGYPDYEAPINNIERKRLHLESFVSWHGF